MNSGKWMENAFPNSVFVLCAYFVSFWWMWVLNFDLNFISQSYQIQTTNMRKITFFPFLFSFLIPIFYRWTSEKIILYEDAKILSSSRKIHSMRTYNFWVWTHANIENKVIFTFIWIIRMASEWKEKSMKCKCETNIILFF